MKYFLISTMMAAALVGVAADKGLLWKGNQEGKDLVTIGYKQVTIVLDDGRTASIGIPILVEHENAYQKTLNQLRARSEVLNRKLHTRPSTNGVSLQELEEINLKIRQIEQQWNP